MHPALEGDNVAPGSAGGDVPAQSHDSARAAPGQSPGAANPHTSWRMAHPFSLPSSMSICGSFVQEGAGFFAGFGSVVNGEPGAFAH